MDDRGGNSEAGNDSSGREQTETRRESNPSSAIHQIDHGHGRREGIGIRELRLDGEFPVRCFSTPLTLEGLCLGREKKGMGPHFCRRGGLEQSRTFWFKSAAWT